MDTGHPQLYTDIAHIIFENLPLDVLLCFFIMNFFVAQLYWVTKKLLRLKVGIIKVKGS